MLVWVRKLLENWIARAFFALLILVFVFWGISNVVTLIGNNNAIAHVDGQAIDASVVQAAYQRALNQAEQSGHGAVDAATKQRLASQALAQVLRQRILQIEEKRLGVTAPGSAIRQAIDTIPAFQQDGKFDKTTFDQVLAQNGLTPDRFVEEVTHQIADRQLVESVVSGAGPSDTLVKRVFNFVSQARTAKVVEIRFADQSQPAAPSDDVLQRYWRNHPQEFTAPEYRTIKLVVLSPQLLAPKQQVSAQEIDAQYARVAAEQPNTPLRSVQVITADNLAASSRLEAAWKSGATWPDMQKMAKRFGANPVELDKTQESGIPSPDLAAAVFKAKPGEVVGPVAGASGMFIFRVTSVGHSGPDAATLKAKIKQQLQLQKAETAVASDVDKLQDALAGQTPLDKLPGDLGLAAVEGTLDAQGKTPDGTPAPIPGGDALQQAVVKAAFAANANDAPHLINGPDGSYFALSVDKITPPAPEPFDQNKAAVLAAWTHHQITRSAEVAAAALMHTVNQGQSMNAAAQAAGDAVTQSPPISRDAPAAGVPQQLVPILFSLRQGQATMLQTKNGFIVAQLATIAQPTPAKEPDMFTKVQQSLAKSLQTDLGESFLAGLQARDKVTVDQKLLAQIAQ
jgi:peptidyl-prolyl cis-trans isomerase D